VSNNSIWVSESLMAELQRAANVEQRSPEEVAEDAVKRYLRLSRRKWLFAYGEGKAERVRIKPVYLVIQEGTVAALAEIRANRSRQTSAKYEFK
jgi:predicted transcriptional regulator